MGQLITLNALELDSIEPSRAEQIKTIFAPMTEMLEGFELAYSEVCDAASLEITEAVTAKAKRLRLDIAKVRISAEKIRKEQKEEYLRAGKAVDGVSNILKWAVEEKEQKLKDIEDYFANLELTRKRELQASRTEILSAYLQDAEGRNLASMEDDVWEAYIGAKKKEHEDRIAAELQAEQERVAKAKAEADEQVRLQAENARLKIEASELAAKVAANAAKERAAREELEAEFAARELQERAARQKLEDYVAAKVALEEQSQRNAEEKLQGALSANDKDKAKAFIADVLALKTAHNNFTSAKHQAMFVEVCGLLDKVAHFVEKRNEEAS